ncbi:MAG TPA: response regulator [Candidatus Anoxymicrobiaceae bacterium]|jgi:DNA-binding response OmpR family regulator
MNGEKLKVLVVEDEPLISEMIAKSLKLEGYQVDSAKTGEEGLQKVREVNPDLVLLDVLLPKIDGWEVLTRMRDDSRTRAIPIIMLTALSDEKSKVQGLRGGADDYVTKPFSSLELMARVEAVLKRADRVGHRDSARSQIPARKGDKIYLVNVDDINFVNIQREYTYLHTDNDRFLTNHTLAELEKMLDPAKFFRAHRGYIVNLQKVKEIIKVGTSSYELTMNDPSKSKIPMSRRQSSELKKILNM